MSDAWDAAQVWESSWWGDCVHTFGEENKQLVYASRMGLHATETPDGQWPVYDLGGASALDLGGGPVSLLLKAVNAGRRTVVDPGHFPDWITARYAAAEIEFRVQRAEDVEGMTADECWLYNVLQHTDDPAKVAAVARGAAPTLRVFEWIETEVNIGHPHAFSKKDLDALFNANGTVEFLNGERGLFGIAYSGVFG
jgi:hypothetical protein